jgi:hypothetical protein
MGCVRGVDLSHSVEQCLSAIRLRAFGSIRAQLLIQPPQFPYCFKKLALTQRIKGFLFLWSYGSSCVCLRIFSDDWTVAIRENLQPTANILVALFYRNNMPVHDCQTETLGLVIFNSFHSLGKSFKSSIDRLPSHAKGKDEANNGDAADRFLCICHASRMTFTFTLASPHS